MKMTKKKLFAVAVAVCMAAILSFSSLAWFTDSDTVTNRFQLAASTGEPDDIFSVDVLEGVDVNGDGDIWDEDEGDHTAGFGKDAPGEQYKDILPGSVLSKRPQAKNTGAYDQYICMHVVVNNYGVWQSILEDPDTVETLWAASLDVTNWTRVDAPVVEGDTITYTYYWNKVLSPDALTDKLFTEVVIPTYLDQYDLARLAQGEFAIDVVAEAIQTENLGTDDVYWAFKTVLP